MARGGGGVSTPTALRVNATHFEKLRELFKRARAARAHDGGDDDDVDDEEDDEESEVAFHRALFCLLLRHKALRGGGFQAAIGAPVFAALREAFGVRFEVTISSSRDGCCSCCLRTAISQPSTTDRIV